jgi:hypothetical protein
MNYIQTLQNSSISILKEGNEKKPLWMLAKYNCSELSWLAGLNVLEDLGPASKPFILKGDVNNSDVEKVENIHDILGYFDSKEGEYAVVDPKVWQFYPERESIYVGSFQTIDEAISEVGNSTTGSGN